jgi:hypothetical protein
MLGERNVGDLNFVMGMKTTKFTKFLNQKNTKACLIPNLDHDIRKKNTTRVKQKSNKILLQRKKKTRLCQDNIPKTNVEQTKGDGEFYFYLLGI